MLSAEAVSSEPTQVCTWAQLWRVGCDDRAAAFIGPPNALCVSHARTLAAFLSHWGHDPSCPVISGRQGARPDTGKPEACPVPQLGPGGVGVGVREPRPWSWWRQGVRQSREDPTGSRRHVRSLSGVGRARPAEPASPGGSGGQRAGRGAHAGCLASSAQDAGPHCGSSAPPPGGGGKGAQG